jgi:hypothetical protein
MSEEHRNRLSACRRNTKVFTDMFLKLISSFTLASFVTPASSFTPVDSFIHTSSELALRRGVQGVFPGSTQCLSFTLALTSLATYSD